jgi:hypothetical protein
MKVAHRTVLKNMYDQLKRKDSIGLFEDSIIKKLVKNGTKAHTRVDFDSVSYHIPTQEVASELEELGYIIKHHSKYYDYSITALGIWEYEKHLKKTNIPDLLSIIHNEYFKPVKKSFDDKDKIILATLLFSRIFCKENQIDTKNDVDELRYNANWYEITIKAMKILDQAKCITKTNHTFVGHANKKYLYKYQNDLPDKSNGIYVRRNGKHYLNVGEKDGKIDEKKVSSVFGYIFGDELDISTFEIIIQQLQSFARKNRFKLDNNKMFLDVGTTQSLTNTLDDKYLSYETN